MVPGQYVCYDEDNKNSSSIHNFVRRQYLVEAIVPYPVNFGCQMEMYGYSLQSVCSKILQFSSHFTNEILIILVEITHRVVFKKYFWKIISLQFYSNLNNMSETSVIQIEIKLKTNYLSKIFHECKFLGVISVFVPQSY